MGEQNASKDVKPDGTIDIKEWMTILLHGKREELAQALHAEMRRKLEEHDIAVLSAVEGYIRSHSTNDGNVPALEWPDRAFRLRLGCV